MRFRLPMQRRSILLDLILNDEPPDQRRQPPDRPEGAGEGRGRAQGQMPAAAPDVGRAEVRLEDAS
jgi:hypothetical protein